MPKWDPSSHFGIGIMSERAQRLRGDFTIGARPGGGTRVRLAWNAGGVGATA
jgi:two-component system, NarL family, nitrate/nitrite sensor histidine kinase NarX